jgi:TonB family protein
MKIIDRKPIAPNLDAPGGRLPTVLLRALLPGLLLVSGHARAESDSAPTPPSAAPSAAPTAPLSTAPTAPPSGTLTKPPVLLQFVEAEFPESEKATTTKAAVVLELLISETGTVVDARVAESAGLAFDAAALTAARAFVFEPAEIDGEKAAIKIRYRYEFSLEEAPMAPTALSGQVRDRVTGQPIAGVTLTLDDGQSAVTDQNGNFVFGGIAAGEHSITLSGEKLGTVMTTETVTEGQTLSVRYDVEILIVAPKPASQVVATRVEAESARKVAGTGGDVLKVVENMPGVARAAAGAGDVIVWGASPKDTRVYVDDVRVPQLYHFGGFRSVVHADLVESVELVPGGYGASYGRGLGGLVTVATKAPSPEQLRGSVQLDLLDAGVAAHGPITENLGASAALRRSHLAEVFSGAVTPEAKEYFPIPRYYDGSARIRYTLSPSEWIEVGGLFSRDSLTRGIGSQDPASRKSETRELGFERALLRYRNEPGDGTRVTLVPWFGHDRSRLYARTGQIPVELTSDTFLYGLRAAWVGELNDHLGATTGMDVEMLDVELQRSGSMSAPPREGDARTFGQPPADQVNADAWKVVSGSAAPYVEADVGLFEDRLHLLPGLRLEPFFASVNRRRPSEGGTADIGAFDADLSLQPRLSLQYRPIPRVALKGAYGRYRQSAEPEDLSSVFGNPLLGTASATHYLLGGSVEVIEKLTLETTAFYTEASELAVRNPLPSPRVAETLVAEGQGRAYGMQLMLRRDLDQGLFGWVAYTLLRSERRDNEDAPWRLFDYDQTHVFTALVSYDLGAGFEIGSRARLSSGYPRTPVVGAYYDGRRDQFEPVLGATNSERIPMFFQVDVRGSKTFRIGKTELETYVDVLNVLNRENPEEIAYDADYGERRYINGLPILPVIGARWSF